MDLRSLIVPGTNVLFIAPHPDDECDNSGALIRAVLDLGADVYVVYMTDGSMGSPNPAERGPGLASVRRAEALEALRVLGIPEERAAFLNYPDSRLAEHVDEASRQLADIITRLRPSVIVVPSEFEEHPDHLASYVATRRAALSSGCGCLLLKYTNYAPRSPLRRLQLYLERLFRSLSVDAREYVGLKLACMAAHRSQLLHMPYWDARNVLLAKREVYIIERAAGQAGGAAGPPRSTSS